MARGGTKTMTPTWVLQWGLVTIPVVKYVVNEYKEEYSFNMLHKPCAMGIKQIGEDKGKPVYAPASYAQINMYGRCVSCGDIMPNPVSNTEEVIRGCKTNDGKFVTFEVEELKKLDSEKSKDMIIQGFVPKSQLNHLRVRNSLYLGSTEMSIRQYALMQALMKDEKVIAIVTYMWDGKDKIGAIESTDDCLLLHEYYFATKWRTFDKQDKAPDVDVVVTPAEKKAGKMLMQNYITDEIKIEDFVDTSRDRVAAEVERRASGQAPKVTDTKTETVRAVDNLLAALEASVGMKPKKVEKKPTTVAPGKASKTGAKKSASAA
jgi:DNA end-binding protein Ku